MLSGVIPTMRGYIDIMNKVLSGDFKGASAAAWDMVKNAGKRALGIADDLTGNKQGAAAEAAGNLINPSSGAAPKAKYSSKAFTPEKAASIARVAKNIGVSPDDLAAVISFETGGTFNPNARNSKSSATGLIQFMAGSGGTKGKYYGMTRDEFGALPFDEQMKYVEKYFKDRDKRFRSGNESNNTVGDVYGAVTGYGYKKGSKAYELNKVWDSNKNGIIEKGEMVLNPNFRAHQRGYFDSISQGAMNAQAVAPAGQASVPASSVNNQKSSMTNIDVNVAGINVNTTASTVLGTVTDAMKAVSNSVTQLIQPMQ